MSLRRRAIRDTKHVMLSSHTEIAKCVQCPGAPLTYFYDGGGGPSDFFGSEILAKGDFFGSMKDATIFFGL